METPLDAAFRAQEADPTLRPRFYERVLDAELVVPLAEEAGESMRPQVFPLEQGPYVLAFDRDKRMGAFLEGPVPFAPLSGRRLVALLAGQGIGIALNLGAPSGAAARGGGRLARRDGRAGAGGAGSAAHGGGGAGRCAAGAARRARAEARGDGGRDRLGAPRGGAGGRRRRDPRAGRSAACRRRRAPAWRLPSRRRCGSADSPPGST
jgi:catechol 2,3-dioxygenase-like lactoylglutathione lyase family enzyme